LISVERCEGGHLLVTSCLAYESKVPHIVRRVYWTLGLFG
jgi:hypothetical protein